MSFADKMQNLVISLEVNRDLLTLKRGFVLLMPILLIGSIALAILNLPIPSFNAWLINDAFLFRTILFYIYNATIGLISLYLIVSLSYSYISIKFTANSPFLLLSMITSILCFTAAYGGVGELSFNDFGPTGMCTALICTYCGIKIFTHASYFLYRNIDFNLLSADIDFRDSLLALLPMLLTFLFFTFINSFIFNTFGFHNFNDILSTGLIYLFAAIQNDFIRPMLFNFMLSIVWFFGIHGGNALDHVQKSIFPINAEEGVTKTLLDSFTAMGGAGVSLSLVIALFISARTRESRNIAYLALPFVIFNINEIVLFALPVVLNPVLFIPFALMPVLSAFLLELALLMGMPVVAGATPAWTMPAFLSGYFLTDSMWGPFLQLIILACGVVIYIPFIKMSEKLAGARESDTIKSMVALYNDAANKGAVPLFLQKPETILVAKNIINTLYTDIQNKSVPVWYQAQVDRNDKVIGAEALLRWKYKGVSLFPPLLITLTRETNTLFTKLTMEIVRSVCHDVVELKKQTSDDLKVSINISSSHLADTKFINYVIEMVRRLGLVGNICLEVTEETALIYDDAVERNLRALKKTGIYLAVDDFSMGQTSLEYLQNSTFDFVKLDGKLVKVVEKNINTQAIITSITELGHKLKFAVIAEYVEGVHMRDILLTEGCSYFQGYLYSPALPMNEFLDFYKKHNAPKPTDPSSEGESENIAV